MRSTLFPEAKFSGEEIVLFVVKIKFHTYNSPILVNKPVNKPIRNREIF